MMRYLLCWLFGHNYKIIGYTTREPDGTRSLRINGVSDDAIDAATAIILGYTLIQRECSFCKSMQTTRLLGVCEYVGNKGAN